MDDEPQAPPEPEPTESELGALSASRQRVIESLRAPVLVFDVPAVRAGNGLSQRGNFIEADRRNPNLNDNPNADSSGLSGYEDTVVTVVDANGKKAKMTVPGKDIEEL